MRYMKYFTGSFIVTAIGLVLAALIGYFENGTGVGVARALFVVSILSVLEVSLSFDNAVVNATVLEKMTPLWRHRFLTWGIAIAVFGMRLVFPLVVVTMVASIGPFDAISLAWTHPEEYAKILEAARPVISAFGGAFLAMVCLKYFFDAEKDVHWIQALESRMTTLGRIYALELALVMAVVYVISRYLPEHEATAFIVAGNMGLITYILVDGIGAILEVGEDQMANIQKASAGMFLYLEVLDASFSFDGVIGAFALTSNIFLIAIGLGVGAMFVRSLTIMLVDEGTLVSYRYLEHGAFYAIGALALIMFLKVIHEVPELITGLIGATFIGLSLLSSVRYRAKMSMQETGGKD